MKAENSRQADTDEEESGQNPEHHGKPEGASRYSWTVDFAALARWNSLMAASEMPE